MAQPIFPARVAYLHDSSVVEEYTPSQTSGETFGYGDFVKLSGSTVLLCAANPASILGISEVVSEAARVLTPNGKIPIRALQSRTVLCMSSTTVPVDATHLNVQYGITRDATTGIWQVDVSKTGVNARVQVVRLNIAEGLWFVEVVAAYLANSTVVS